jgi:hypothetical protein
VVSFSSWTYLFRYVQSIYLASCRVKLPARDTFHPAWPAPLFFVRVVRTHTPTPITSALPKWTTQRNSNRALGNTVLTLPLENNLLSCRQFTHMQATFHGRTVPTCKERAAENPSQNTPRQYCVRPFREKRRRGRSPTYVFEFRNCTSLQLRPSPF